jgi:hypothetical protein
MAYYKIKNPYLTHPRTPYFCWKNKPLNPTISGGWLIYFRIRLTTLNEGKFIWSKILICIYMEKTKETK